MIAIAPRYLIAGVDEVGRGPLAGSVVAAAVILDPARPISGLLDSKVLNEARREQLSAEILARALAWSICEASVAEIDRLNILHASLLAMQRALDSLSMRPNLALVDGNRCPPGSICPAVPVIKGDARVQAISAASIIAKVARDRMMVALHAEYPQYGFDRHKGYPTAQHRQALAVHGVLPLHRRSFGPVRQALANPEPCAAD